MDGSLVSFVVEDKGGTKMHGDQLDRYRKAVQDDKLEENHFEMDHIVPVAKGGQDWVDNFQLSCSNCNRIKGKGTQEAARAKIAKNKGIDFGGVRVGTAYPAASISRLGSQVYNSPI